MQQVKAGLKAIYLSGWQVAGDANLAGQMYPDQSLYPANSVPQVVRRINNALQRCDQIQWMEGVNAGDPGHVDFMAPIIADAEAGFGGVLKPRHREGGAGGSGAADVADSRVQSLLNSYFGADEDQLPDDDRFLKQYILKKGWVARDGGAGSSDDDGGSEIDAEDEDFMQRANAFEANYNVRYEEPGGAELATHPRSQEGTVRKEDDRRKRARAERAARKAAEEEERKLRQKKEEMLRAIRNYMVNTEVEFERFRKAYS
jgi:hypothetical protein